MKSIKQQWQERKKKLSCFAFGKLKLEISKALFDFDILGIAKPNAMICEYDREASGIMIALELCKSLKDVQKIVCKTFQVSLDCQYQFSKFEKISQKIWKIWEKNGKKILV